jgi:SAM-dependent methyltransferase
LETTYDINVFFKITLHSRPTTIGLTRVLRGDLIVDPTCGSGTAAYVAEQWGRRWITIDTSRVAVALARSRLMGARYPYYLLADSPGGQKKEAEVHPYSAQNHADARRRSPRLRL